MQTVEIDAHLDPNVPTELDDGSVVTAAEALTAGPASMPMHAYTRRICEWLTANGGTSVDCVADYDASTTRPGGLMVRWGRGPTSAAVAEQFGPIPVWCQLRPDDHDRTGWIV